MIKLFTLIKQLFNVDNVESVTDEMVENYFAKQDEVVNNEEKVDEPVADTPVEPVVDNTDVKEVVEAEVNPPTPVEPVADEPVEPVVDEPKEDDKKDEPKDKPQEVLTKDVISNAANNINYKDNLMTLTGDAFFSALHKHASELRKFR